MFEIYRTISIICLKSRSLIINVEFLAMPPPSTLPIEASVCATRVKLKKMKAKQNLMLIEIHIWEHTGEFICAKHDIMKGQKKKAAPTGKKSP